MWVAPASRAQKALATAVDDEREYCAQRTRPIFFVFRLNFARGRRGGFGLTTSRVVVEMALDIT